MDNISINNVKNAIVVLRQGGIVAFPTETYYGLAVDPFNRAALKRLFQVKKRKTSKPILTLVHDINQLSCLTDDIPQIYRGFMKQFWPGPLTLVFKGLSLLPDLLTGNTGTVGVRISSHPMAKQLVAAFQSPITATSANISGEEAAVSASEIEAYFGSTIDMILDGGKTPGGVGSTIIGLRGAQLHLIRDGMIPFNKITSCTGDCGHETR